MLPIMALVVVAIILIIIALQPAVDYSIPRRRPLRPASSSAEPWVVALASGSNYPDPDAGPAHSAMDRLVNLVAASEYIDSRQRLARPSALWWSSYA